MIFKLFICALIISIVFLGMNYFNYVSYMRYIRYINNEINTIISSKYHFNIEEIDLIRIVNQCLIDKNYEVFDLKIMFLEGKIKVSYKIEHNEKNPIEISFFLS